ncbi:MAG: SxtJ family membrane protein [Candidatus Krumholzibacteria bacterium]|jgi:hypothetical protein|nr:SxtJ family membrane protein [Candidatus Krumholzibacteria bacterium]
MSQASRQIWNWQTNTAAAVAERAERDAARWRRRGLWQGLAIAIAGTLANKLLGHELAGRLLVMLGAAQALVALTRPRLLASATRHLRRFGEAVGRALAWMLLGPLWLVVFVPVGLLLRMQRRDPLHRAPSASGRTAWIPRRAAASAGSCARQFLIEDPPARALARPVGALPEPELLRDLAGPADGERGGGRA